MHSISLFAVLLLKLKHLKSSNVFGAQEKVIMPTIAPAGFFVPQVSKSNGLFSQSRIFVPSNGTPSCLAATSTTTINVPTHGALGLTAVTNAEEIIPDRLAVALVQQFNPLPVKSPTPLNVLTFSKELESYPDMSFKDDLLHNINQGFKIGYAGPEFSNKAYNLMSASQYHQKILENIGKCAWKKFN